MFSQTNNQDPGSTSGYYSGHDLTGLPTNAIDRFCQSFDSGRASYTHAVSGGFGDAFHSFSVGLTPGEDFQSAFPSFQHAVQPLTSPHTESHVEQGWQERGLPSFSSFLQSSTPSSGPSHHERQLAGLGQSRGSFDSASFPLISQTTVSQSTSAPSSTLQHIQPLPYTHQPSANPQGSLSRLLNPSPSSLPSPPSLPTTFWYSSGSKITPTPAPRDHVEQRQTMTLPIGAPAPTAPILLPENAILKDLQAAEKETEDVWAAERDGNGLHDGADAQDDANGANTEEINDVLASSRHDLLAQEDDSTHAQRLGPGARLQPLPRRPARKNLSDAQKATQALNQQAARQKHAELMAAVDALASNHERAIQDLARAHAVKVDNVKNLLNHSKHFKTRREPSAWNAKLAAIAAKHRDAGETMTAEEIRREARENDEYLNASKEQVQEWVARLAEERLNAKLGARRDNKGAATDFNAFVKQVLELATGVEARTGAAVIMIAAPSNVSDTFQPAWCSSQNASKFMHEVLHRTPWDLSRQLGQWVSVKEKSITSVAEMQKECSSLVSEGLRFITGRDTACMNYANYEKVIVAKLGVKLEGWTHSDMVVPTAISDRADVERLLKALQTGECRWIRLTSAQSKAHQKSMEERESRGEQVGRKRKERSDRGVVKGPRKKKALTNSTVSNADAADSDSDAHERDDDYNADSDAVRPQNEYESPSSAFAAEGDPSRLSAGVDSDRDDRRATTSKGTHPAASQRPKTTGRTKKLAKRGAQGKENAPPAKARGRLSKQLPPALVQRGGRSRSIISTTDDEDDA